MIKQKYIERVRVPSGEKIRLADYPTSVRDFKDIPELNELDKDELKERAHEILRHNLEELAEAQELLWASDRYSVLVVFQALDAAGKDGTIKHVMSGLNPQGCQVFSFKKPSDEELDHNFLWRYMRALPERGRIGIFNRSHYEDVLVVRVHPELLERAKLPPGKRDKDFWDDRYRDINALERHLVANGTRIVKFFLNVSRDEQKRRFLERLEKPEKHWKFSAADLAERGYWDDYMNAYGEALSATSTKWAPWYVIPADQKYVTRALVADILASAIGDLKLEFPKVGKEQLKFIQEAKKKLENE